MKWHLAQVNVGRFIKPVEDPANGGSGRRDRAPAVEQLVS